MKWSEDEIKLLKKLYPDPNVSREEILTQIHRTWKAIQSKVYSLGIRERKYIPRKKKVFDIGNIDDHVF